MAKLLMQLASICMLLLCISHRSEAVVVTYDTARSSASHEFWTTTWNYTVSPGRDGGVFKIMRLNLTDSSLIFFNWPSGNTVCPDKMEDILREDVVKVYDETTKIGRTDPPDIFRVQSGSVLCFMKLERKRYGDRGEFVYIHKDNGASSSATTRHPVYFKYKIQNSFRSAYKERCMAIPIGRNVAFEMNGGMSDIKSLNNVKVFYTERYRSGMRSGELHTLIHLTSRTPASSYKRLHVLPTGYRREPERICFAYEVINGTREDFKDNVTFLITVFRICSINMTEPSGLLTTQNYPDPLYNRANCTTHITALPGQRISLSFLDAKIDCNHGYVMLRSQNRPAVMLCGGSLKASASYLSESNTLSLQVRNKGRQATDRGYFVKYKAIGCGIRDAILPPHSRILNDNVGFIHTHFKMRVGCEHGYVFPTLEREITLECRENRTWDRHVPICVEHSFCNKTLTASNGTIESPSYPNAFPKDTTCEWKIQVKKGQNIKVTVVDLSAFCKDNFLLIDSAAKGSTDGRYHRYVLCSNGGDYVSESYYTWDNEVSVLFKSNFLKDSGYFRIKYEAIGCSMEQFPTNRYKIIEHYSLYYKVGSKLKFDCPIESQYFLDGESEHYLTCGADGKFSGTFPLCSPAE
ncbi:CUB and sushi domain-containing protein 1-like [Lineus longissimus]|uniref:CUB and sushi domain-containing protein 1-like n=1 Tax=Lineus longissimus TaxID=88925 RepID=UPI00315D7439